MRARKFGLSDDYINSTPPKSRHSPRHFIYPPVPSSMPRYTEQAATDYRIQRQNGTDQDNPERPFPQDGTYDWVLETDIEDHLKFPPNTTHYRCRYTQGSLDKAWMEERDQNYLARRAREEAPQQDAGAGVSTAACEAVDDSAAAAPPPETQTSARSNSTAISPSP